MAAKVAFNMSEFGSVLLIGASSDVANSVSIDTYIGPREGQGPLGALVDAMYNSKHDFLLSALVTHHFSKSRISLDLLMRLPQILMLLSHTMSETIGCCRAGMFPLLLST